jgi:hypothetical protein
MTPTTVALLILACVRGGHISPFQVTCEPLLEWVGGPIVYRVTLKNVSRAEVTVVYTRRQPHVSVLSLEGPVPGARDSVIVPRYYTEFGDGRPTTEYERLAPGRTMWDVVHVHRTWQGRLLKYPARLTAVWHVTYTLDKADKPAWWCSAEIACPFTARPVKPTAAEIDRFIESGPPIRWMEYTDKLEFLPLLFDVGTGRPAVDAMYSIVETAKAPLDTVPKYLLAPNPRRSAIYLFGYWKDRDGKRRPSKEMIAELSQAPNEWVQLLTWATFPDEVRDPPPALKRVRDLMCPAPIPDILALVKQLDDPAFKVREEASQKLTKQLTETTDVDGMLYHVLSRPGSAERHQRIKQILEAEPKVTSTAQRVVATLAGIDNPRAAQLLESIAAGPDGLRATQAAKKIVEARKERQRQEQRERLNAILEGLHIWGVL